MFLIHFLGGLSNVTGCVSRLTVVKCQTCDEYDISLFYLFTLGQNVCAFSEN